MDGRMSGKWGTARSRIRMLNCNGRFCQAVKKHVCSYETKGLKISQGANVKTMDLQYGETLDDKDDIIIDD